MAQLSLRVYFFAISLFFFPTKLTATKDIRQTVEFGRCGIDDYFDFAADNLNPDCQAALGVILGSLASEPDSSLSSLDAEHVDSYDKLCVPSCGQKVVDWLRETCESEDIAEFGVAVCAQQPDQGPLCYDAAVQGLNDTVAVTEECYPYDSESPCPETCKNALENVSAILGCCVLNFYDGVFRESEHASQLVNSAVWDWCEVDYPTDRCSSTLRLESDSSLASSSAAASVLVIFVGIAMLVIM